MKQGSWVADLLDLLMPAGCVACGAWIGGGTALVCVGCRTRLREPIWPRCARCHHPLGTGRTETRSCLDCRSWPAELTAARYAFALDAPADDLVHALKYGGWRELADVMAQAMVERALPSDAVRRTIVPMPTTPKRLRERGYNQAELLAERISARTGLPLARALRRVSGERSQTELAPSERRDNVRGVFEAETTTVASTNDHVLLVDDVLTTGATASEAAVTLAAAGAGSVTLLTFARALPKSSATT